VKSTDQANQHENNSMWMDLFLFQILFIYYILFTGFLHVLKGRDVRNGPEGTARIVFASTHNTEEPMFSPISTP